MQRLTFKEPNGNFGVIGMDSENEQKKLYICVLKLLDYEETGLNPDNVIRLIDKVEDMEENLQTIENEMNLLKSRISIGTIISGYRILGIYKNRCIAERVNKISCDDYVVWQIDEDMQGVNSGKYFEFYEFAKAYFMSVMF